LPSQLAPEYAAIVDAIQAGDPVQAVLLIDTNLADTSSRIITHLQKHRPE
jgi:DNA-binding FadR family transcriptional regulator